MLKNVSRICLLTLSLAGAGCQSLPSVVQPPRLPAPPAWTMEQFEPTLTPRMVQELSVSPEKETGPSER